MLPAAVRMRRADDFAQTIRGGVRSGAPRLVVHLRVLHPPVSGAAPLVGFVVSRGVGSSVVRTRVKRRLRHQVRDRLTALPSGSRLVVRALPPAAGASSTELGGDLDGALAGAVRTAARRAGRPRSATP